jgi:hypothetical protein
MGNFVMSTLKDFTSAITQPVAGEIARVNENQVPPSGYLECDGSIVSQATYPDLFNQLGLFPDGVATWTARTSGTASSIVALTYGNNLYVYAGLGGVLATSTNAITWTARTSGTTNVIQALIYADNLYVYAGNGGVLATAAKYTYNTATEFVLPLGRNILQNNTYFNTYMKGD